MTHEFQRIHAAPSGSQAALCCAEESRRARRPHRQLGQQAAGREAPYTVRYASDLDDGPLAGRPSAALAPAG